jgi:hypothetical protein
MREWWHDVLINLAGGVGAALIGAALLALAAHFAKFFKQEEASDPLLFAKITSVAGISLGVLTVVAALAWS